MRSSSKRVAKNTIFLYIRMILLMIISLYTSRIILKELGITDYGVYNVVGGLITIFSFINGSMAQATQRFITYELGCNQINLLTRVFSTSVYVHLFIAILIIILGETVGLWYLYNHIVIPTNRFNAAVWIYQFSILIAAINIITVPYNALIIAHEKMASFAYLTILEAILKLLVAFILSITLFDKLIVYGVSLLIIAVLMRIIYGVYAKRKFSEARLLPSIDYLLIKKMGAYAGWSLWGSLAAAGFSQGLNLLINAFFNPTINAARGIAVQVQSIIRNFSGNFQVAINPQITKSYASNDKEYMYTLIYKGSLYSFFLFFLVSFPVFLEINTLLGLWLVQVPDHTGNFIRIMLLISCVEILASPLNVSAQATGKIRNFETSVSVILLSIVPLSYFALKIYRIPEIVFFVNLLLVCIAHLVRLYILKKLIGLSIEKYLTKVLLKIFLIVITASLLPLFLHSFYREGIIRLFIVSLSSIITTSTCIYMLGFNYQERLLVKNKLKTFLSKNK